MARMTRTQITLEEAEYRFLKTQAAASGVSFSAVVRGLVRDRMDRAGGRFTPCVGTGRPDHSKRLLR